MSSEKHQQDASAEAVSTLERLISRASKKTRDEFIHKKSEIISAAYQRKLSETKNKASGIRTSEHPVPIRPWTDELLELIASYGCKAMKEVASELGQQFGRWWASAMAKPSELSRIRDACDKCDGEWPGRGYKSQVKPTLPALLFGVIRPGGSARDCGIWWKQLVGQVVQDSDVTLDDAFAIAFVRGVRAILTPPKRHWKPEVEFPFSPV